MKNRLKRDSANSIVIMGMAIFLLILLLSIFAIDYTKSVYMKNAYQTMAQNATATAIKEQNTTGGLKHTAVQAAIEEYMRQRSPEAAGGLGTKETESFRTNECLQGTSYPHIEIQFDNGRTVGTRWVSPVYVSENGQIPNVPVAEFADNKYKVINMRVTDVADNYFWGMFTGRCYNEVTVETSSVIINADWNASDDDFYD